MALSLDITSPRKDNGGDNRNYNPYYRADNSKREEERNEFTHTFEE